MANCCYFLMKITGREEAVQEFIRMLQWKDAFSTCGMGRVQEFEVDEDTAEYSEYNREFYSIEGQGDCDWSLKSALQDFEARSLLKETERLGLAIEAFSSEPGCEFQEHLLIDRGKVLIEDCVDYEEYMVDGANEEQIQKLLAEKNLTRDELMSAVNHNGDYCVGGFETFGEFRDLFPYVLSMQLQYDASWGESYTIYPHMGKYDENNNLFLALACFDKERKDVVPFSDITINAGKLPYLHSAITPFVIEEGLLDFLSKNGFGQLTGEQIQSGFSSYPIFRFNEDKLREVSPLDFTAYARANGQQVLPKSSRLDAKIQSAGERAGETPASGNVAPVRESER